MCFRFSLFKLPARVWLRLSFCLVLHSLIFRKHFILVRVTKGPELILGSLDTRSEQIKINNYVWKMWRSDVFYWENSLMKNLKYHYSAVQSYLFRSAHILNSIKVMFRRNLKSRCRKVMFYIIKITVLLTRILGLCWISWPHRHTERKESDHVNTEGTSALTGWIVGFFLNQVHL